MHIHTESWLISHAGNRKQGKKTYKNLIEGSGNNKAQLSSVSDKARTRNCIFMVTEGNSRPDKSQSGNIETWKVLNKQK